MLSTAKGLIAAQKGANIFCDGSWVTGRHTLDSGKLLAHHLVHSRHLKGGTYYYGEATLSVVRAQVLE